jgi:hypothetical protein
MTDPTQLDALRGRFFTGEQPAPSATCLDADTMAALAEGSLEPAARGAAIQHVSSCTLCRQAVASVAKALDDGPITHEIQVVEGHRRRSVSFLRVALPLAAAAVIVVLLRAPAGDSPVHRGPPPPPAATPILRSPVGVVAAVGQMQWTHVDGAELYRLTLFDVSSRVVFTAAVADTLLILPDSVGLVPNRTYLWKVDARIGFDRWAASELAEFSVAGSRRQ